MVFKHLNQISSSCLTRRIKDTIHQLLLHFFNCICLTIDYSFLRRKIVQYFFLFS